MHYYPMLVIASDVQRMIATCAQDGFPVVTGSLEDIIFKLNSFRGLTLSSPVVVGDIASSIVGGDVSEGALKIVEELSVEAIFFSSEDCFTDVFMSRFMRVIKKGVLIINKSNSISEFFSRADGIEPIDSKRIIEECPAFLPFHVCASRHVIPSSQKVVGLLA